MAYTTVNKSTSHMNTLTYGGNDATGRAMTGVGFQPGWSWFKDRSNATSHSIFDEVRGATKNIVAQTTAAESTSAQGLQAFGADGFTLGSDGDVNGNNNNYVSWNWKGSGSQGSSNTDGSINTTYTSVNTTAGFSISKYTGTGSNATVGHGLGAVPKMIIFKRLDSADDWTVYHSALGATKKTDLNNNGVSSSVSSVFNNTEPTSTVMSVGTNGRTNASSGTYVAYAFAEKIGYSKFGKIDGNSNNNGPFVYTGFAPSFVLYRKSNGAGDWYFVDNKRPGYNDINKRLYANTNQAEESYNLINLYSNGFKLTDTTHTYSNDSGGSYMYMAFGQSLVGSNNVPCTAR